MINIAYVAPFFLPTTVRFLRAVVSLTGVRVALIHQDAYEKLPAILRHSLVAHKRVQNALDPNQIAGAITDLTATLGEAHQLLGTLEQLQVPLAVVREHLGISGMNVNTAKNFRDKAQMKAVLRNAGLPVARSRLVTDPVAATAFAKEVGYPIVIKPPAGAGGVGTHRANSAAEVFALMKSWGRRPTLCEEFIQGREHSLDVVTLNGTPVWHSITRYSPTPLEVLQNPWIQWTICLPREVDAPHYDDIRATGFAALKSLGMGSGLSHMEWFRRHDGSVAISEVGARPPGAQIVSLMSWAHDIDVYAAWARSVVLKQFDPPRRKYAAGVAFLRGQGEGRVVDVTGLEAAQKILGHLVVETRLPRAGQRPGSGYEGEGYVILRHPETSVVEAALHKLITTVQVKISR